MGTLFRRQTISTAQDYGCRLLTLPQSFVSMTPPIRGGTFWEPQGNPSRRPSARATGNQPSGVWSPVSVRACPTAATNAACSLAGLEDSRAIGSIEAAGPDAGRRATGKATWIRACARTQTLSLVLALGGAWRVWYAAAHTPIDLRHLSRQSHWASRASKAGSYVRCSPSGHEGTLYALSRRLRLRTLTGTVKSS